MKKSLQFILLESKEINSNDNSKYKISKYFFPSISWQLNDRKPRLFI